MPKACKLGTNHMEKVKMNPYGDRLFVSAIVMKVFSIAINKPEEIVVRIDHPFFYGIISSKPQEESYLTLFSGYVSDFN